MSSCSICNVHGEEGAALEIGRAHGRWVLRHHGNSGSKPTPLLGWLFLDTVRHVGGAAEFDDAEAREFGALLRRASRLVKQLTGADRVYVIAFGEAHAHVHAHLVPRVHGVDDTKAWNVADLYRAVAALERPSPASADDVAAFVERARVAWADSEEDDEKTVN
jgi:diadenosine tetraphosphate (Ap4A) HIT family hydrolase